MCPRQVIEKLCDALLTPQREQKGGQLKFERGAGTILLTHFFATAEVVINLGSDA